MNKFYGYIRVSTARQGEHGVSLQQQRDAIAAFAERNQLSVISWFEERETAAKRGRPVFSKMLKLLKSAKANGVIMHKIDRSARNLKDWADLGELIDTGVRVCFANESLDLNSRGGRLSADIQAVVAADYIRNLREETKKGFYGRVKQGFYPRPAPIGYLDAGAGKSKLIDPETAPLVRTAFDLYATGRFGLCDLQDELEIRGLRTRTGSILSRNGLSVMLKNPFYIGLIRIRNELFPGLHDALISKSTFDAVQMRLAQNGPKKQFRHFSIFSKLLQCKGCGHSLILEKQKGHRYYRCHSNRCSEGCLREELIEQAFRAELSRLQFSQAEVEYVPTAIQKSHTIQMELRKSSISALEIKRRQLEERVSGLTDAYLDKAIEKDIFLNKKTALQMERRQIDEKLEELRVPLRMTDRLQGIINLATNATRLFDVGTAEEKRELLEAVTSNRFVDRKNIEITLRSPFDCIAEHNAVTAGSPERIKVRTLDQLLTRLLKVLPFLAGQFSPPLFRSC
jgi:site-specific DNA recombinase